MEVDESTVVVKLAGYSSGAIYKILFNVIGVSVFLHVQNLCF